MKISTTIRFSKFTLHVDLKSWIFERKNVYFDIILEINQSTNFCYYMIFNTKVGHPHTCQNWRVTCTFGIPYLHSETESILNLFSWTWIVLEILFLFLSFPCIIMYILKTGKGFNKNMGCSKGKHSKFRKTKYIHDTRYRGPISIVCTVHCLPYVNP